MKTLATTFTILSLLVTINGCGEDPTEEDIGQVENCVQDGTFTGVLNVLDPDRGLVESHYCEVALTFRTQGDFAIEIRWNLERHEAYPEECFLTSTYAFNGDAQCDGTLITRSEDAYLYFDGNGITGQFEDSQYIYGFTATRSDFMGCN